MFFKKFSILPSHNYAPLSQQQGDSMHPPRSHRRLIVFVAIVATSALLFVVASSDTRPPAPPKPHAQPPAASPSPAAWRFDSDRDALNLGLSDDQCTVAFPDLYQELDRARDWYKSQKPIREDDVKIWRGAGSEAHGQVHALIHNGQLIVIDEKDGEADRSRALAALASIHRAISALPDPRVIPNIEFVLDTADVSDGGPEDRVRWSWCRRNGDQYAWVMPDFDGWSYPDNGVGSYTAFRENVQDVEIPWDHKIPQLVWRGSTGVAHELRMSLLNASADKSWSDVRQINWMTREGVLPMHEFCKYQYLAHTEGNSWSGRLRYLQNCASVSVIHSFEYVAHYYPLLQSSGPRQNHVGVRRDFADLDSQMQHLVAHPEEARAIAAESVRTFRDRYLTPAAEACYWRRMFRDYAEAQAFVPRLYETQMLNGEMVRGARRGQSWERFAFHQKGSMEHGFLEPER